MKNIILTAVFTLLVSSFTNAQIDRPPLDKFDEFVQEIYTGDNAQYMQPNTSRYKYVKKMYAERIVYKQISAANIEAKGYPLLSEVALANSGVSVKGFSFDKNTFNPLNYKYSIHDTQMQSFVIDGTNTVMIIMPQNVRQNN